MPSNPGSVEAGVYVSFAALGILEPTTALECLAVRLAKAIDSAKYAKDLPPLSMQLRQTLIEVAEQPAPTTDAVEEMADRY